MGPQYPACIDFPCAESECVYVGGGGGGGARRRDSLYCHTWPGSQHISKSDFHLWHTFESGMAKLFSSDILIFTSPEEFCHIFKWVQHIVLNLCI